MDILEKLRKEFPNNRVYYSEGNYCVGVGNAEPVMYDLGDSCELVDLSEDYFTGQTPPEAPFQPGDKVWLDGLFASAHKGYWNENGKLW